MKRALLYGALSGILTTSSHANPFFEQGMAPLTFAALVPLFLSWMRSTSLAQAQGAGLSFSLVATTGQSFWLAFFGEFSIFTLGGVIVGYLLYFALFSYLIWHLVQSRLPFKPLLLALFWTFYEVAKSTGFLAHPWGLIAYPLHNATALIQIIDSIGVFGFGFFIALVNSALTFLLLGKDVLFTRQLACAALASFGVFGLYGTYTLATIPEPDKTLPILLVQTNEDPWVRGREEQVLETTIELSKSGLAAHPETELVVWSETLLKQLYFNSFYLRTPSEDPLPLVLSRYPVSWLIGAPAFLKAPIPVHERSWLTERIEGHPFLGQEVSTLSEYEREQWWHNLPAPRNPYEPTNAILHIQASGHVRNTYAKRKLVPFAEKVPFLKVSPFSWIYKTIGISALWEEGQEVGIFDLLTRSGEVIKLGLLICFEDAFDLLGRETVQEGADLFVNLTNDGWSKTESAEWQHHIVAKFRTIENRRTLVRSTNGGVTSVVDAWGRTLTVLPLFEAGSLACEVPIYNTVTSAYTRLGDWFVCVLSLIFLGVVILSQKPNWFSRWQ